MCLFRFLKLIMGLKPPFFFGIVKMLLKKPGVSVASMMAPFLSRLATSSAHTASICWPITLSGGSVFCNGRDTKSMKKPRSTTLNIQGL